MISYHIQRVRPQHTDKVVVIVAKCKDNKLDSITCLLHDFEYPPTDMANYIQNLQTISVLENKGNINITELKCETSA